MSTMNWTRAGMAFLIVALAGSAAMAVAAGPQGPDLEKGRRIMNGACAECHDLRPIETQANDTEGWSKTVGAMIERGAKVTKEEIPDLIGYLVSAHGPLPEGAGKKILLNTCTVCHDLERVRSHEAARDEWEGILVAMLGEGADLKDEDFPVILTYLARNFRPQQ